MTRPGTRSRASAHINGVQYDMLCLGTTGLLFESATGRFAGDGDPSPSAGPAAVTLVDFSTQPRPAPAETRPGKPAASDGAAGPIPSEKGVTTGRPKK